MYTFPGVQTQPLTHALHVFFSPFMTHTHTHTHTHTSCVLHHNKSVHCNLVVSVYIKWKDMSHRPLILDQHEGIHFQLKLCPVALTIRHSITAI